MTAMKLQLVLCFLLGLYSLSSAYRQYEARFQQKAGGYVHAGRVEVYIDGHWGTICASDWDMNDAEVVCKELGKGYANTITVTGGTPQGAGTHCLSRVNCYGHESRLSDCEVTPSTRVSSTSDKGIVCYPPTSEAGIKLIYGPDQYSGLVEVKLASGSWSPLFYAWWSASEWSTRPKPASICRQLGFGELDWWDVYVHTSNVGMTYVYSCAYGIADHRSCTYSSLSNPYRAFVGCHKPGSISCSAPYIPVHATIANPRLNYNFTDRVTVTCDTSSDTFTLQCHNKGLWSGPVVSCPESTAVAGPAKCSAPFIPRYSSIETLQLNYNHGDEVTVRCDNNTVQPFNLHCRDTGLWSGPVQSCPSPIVVLTRCSAPYIPRYASIDDVRLSYNYGESVTVTCDTRTDRSYTLQCNTDGIWTGRIVSCPQPIEAPEQCSAPYIPRYASIGDLRLNYDYGDTVIVTCDNSTARFTLQCHTKGRWSGQVTYCPEPVKAPIPCSAPYVPNYATVEGLRLNYNYGERVIVTCDISREQFTLQCHTQGLWSGPNIECPEPIESPPQCSSPALPRHSSIEGFQMTYDYGDSVEVNCDTSNARFTIQCSNNGFWSGDDISCPEPTEVRLQCKAPALPRHSSIEGFQMTYDYGNSVTVTCDTSNARFNIQCSNNGFWSGPDISCPEPTEVRLQCSAPALPRHSSIEAFRMTYDYGNSVTVTCDTSDDRFTIQCSNNGLWSGPSMSCPGPTEGSIPCSAPYTPRHSTIEDLRLNYIFGDRVNVTCDTSSDTYTLQCHNKGLWSGPVVYCPEPARADFATAVRLHDFCSAPAVPPDSTVQNLRLTYKMGDEINVTCNHGPGWFLLECEDGIWSGQNVVCPVPVIECNPPIIPAVSSIGDLKPRYKIGDVVNVECNDGSDSFIWECQVDGLWRGSAVRCAVSQPLTTGAADGRIGIGKSIDKADGRDFFITGLLIAAVIMFILVLMSIVAFSISLKSRSSGPSKDTIQDDKADRGPLPDVPDGYAKYIVGDKSLYVEPYQKLNDLPLTYETYEKPV